MLPTNEEDGPLRIDGLGCYQKAERHSLGDVESNKGMHIEALETDFALLGNALC